VDAYPVSESTCCTPIHPHLRHSLCGCRVPLEDLAGSSLYSEFSPISVSGHSLQWGRGMILFKASVSGDKPAILGSLACHSVTVPNNQQNDKERYEQK
jgi:hypothetical protein